MAATINFKSNTYAGEVLADLLIYTAQGCDTYAEKLIHIKSGIQKSLALPHMQLGKIIQANKPTPTSQDGEGNPGQNEYQISERYLTPEDFMVYLEFNPRDYEQFWRPFQPQGPLVFRDLDPQVQATMLRLLIDKKDQYLNDAIWLGRKGGVDSSKITAPAGCTDPGDETTGGPMEFFNGALVRILDNINPSASPAEKASGEVILAGNTELDTGEKIEAALYAMWRKSPKKVRKSAAMKFVMGWEVWDIYDQYLTAKDHKYKDNSLSNKRTFKGKEIVVIDGAPEHTILFGKFTNTSDSCLWAGVDYANDEEALVVDRKQANSELYFFQMRMKMDVNIVRPSEIVVWTQYKNV